MSPQTTRLPPVRVSRGELAALESHRRQLAALLGGVAPDRAGVLADVVTRGVHDLEAEIAEHQLQPRLGEPPQATLCGDDYPFTPSLAQARWRSTSSTRRSRLPVILPAPLVEALAAVWSRVEASTGRATSLSTLLQEALARGLASLRMTAAFARRVAQWLDGPHGPPVIAPVRVTLPRPVRRRRAPARRQPRMARRRTRPARRARATRRPSRDGPPGSDADPPPEPAARVAIFARAPWR